MTLKTKIKNFNGKKINEMNFIFNNVELFLKGGFCGPKLGHYFCNRNF